MPTPGLPRIAAALKTSTDHVMRDRPVDAYSQLSVFECSCGQVFYPLQADEPREWPSLPAVHRAFMAALTVSVEPLELHEAALLENIVPGSTFVDHLEGKLHRLVGPNEWLSQDGHPSELHGLALYLVWAPAA